MLLTAGLPSVGADGASPADSLAQWRMVAARVGLTPEQHALLADWRRRFLRRLDDCYGRRLLHKAQLAQLPGGGAAAPAPPGQPPQWVEALLLQAAESVGFSACALAGAQLEGVVTALQENLREERAAAGAMMAELLDRILTKVRAGRAPVRACCPFCVCLCVCVWGGGEGADPSVGRRTFTRHAAAGRVSSDGPRRALQPGRRPWHPVQGTAQRFRVVPDPSGPAVPPPAGPGSPLPPGGAPLLLERPQLCAGCRQPGARWRHRRQAGAAAVGAAGAPAAGSGARGPVSWPSCGQGSPARAGPSGCSQQNPPLIQLCSKEPAAPSILEPPVSPGVQSGSHFVKSCPRWAQLSGHHRPALAPITLHGSYCTTSKTLQRQARRRPCLLPAHATLRFHLLFFRPPLPPFFPFFLFHAAQHRLRACTSAGGRLPLHKIGPASGSLRRCVARQPRITTLAVPCCLSLPFLCLVVQLSALSLSPCPPSLCSVLLRCCAGTGAKCAKFLGSPFQRQPLSIVYSSLFCLHPPPAP